ncbi:PLU-1-like protein-domain-containing protein [Scheffersomyces amazonensis]|uniref:PLU-1-like protein-domain-containing protein n=1 Tax=Scheffersomyces amazonensis TaxID=1078765 RepID=UPI00315CF818
MNEEQETSKFPKTSRFFTTSGLPDLRMNQFTRDNKPIIFNGQATGINYNPYTFPQSKTKANIPLDFYNLPSKISIVESIPNIEQEKDIEIPTFNLNENDSIDPIKFIETIEEDSGKKYGAIKVKLSDTDNSNLIKSKIQINSDLFWFESNKLLNNPNKNELTSRLQFQKELIDFHCLHAHSTKATSAATATQTETATEAPRKPVPSFLSKLPMVDKRPLDLYKLFRSVIIRGGFQEVIAKKLWAQIGRELGYRGKIMTSLSSSLKSSYQRILYPYELYLRDKREHTKSETQPKVESTTVVVNDNNKRPAEEDLSYSNDIKKSKSNSSSKPKSCAPLIIGSAKEFKRSIRSKTSKGFLINAPHLIEVKPLNTFVIKPSEQDINQGKKSRKFTDNIETPILPQSQMDRALKFMIDNQSVLEDKSRMKSSVNSSFYTLRQFMEKDLKFQEFILEHHGEKFNASPNGYYKNSISNGYVHDAERKAIDIDSFEKLYWKFINNEEIHPLGNNGLELESGVDIPSYINGSAFVQLGDDVPKYKNSCHNLSLINSTNKAINANIKIGGQGTTTGTSTTTDTTTTNTSTIPTTTTTTTNTSSNASTSEASYFNTPEYISSIVSAALLPWNLHNLPILPNSLLGCFSDSDLNNKELVNTRLNIGMTFSTDNWRCEDHFTNSINYHFFGAVKRWYFIPESEFEKFQLLVKEINEQEISRININNINWNIEELTKYLVNSPYLDYDNLMISLENMINPISDIRLPHINEYFQSLIELKSGQSQSNSKCLKYNQEFFITPKLLKERGIKFTTTLQRPGEFIIKLPKTYSACVSFGFSLSEEVNFATKNWLDYALEAETWLSNQSTICNFSTFKLLINLIQIYDSGQSIGFNSDIYNKIRPIYDNLLEQELELRSKIRKLKIKEVLIDEKQFQIFDNEMISDDDLRYTFPTKVVVIDNKSKHTLNLTMNSFLEYYEDNKFDPKNFTFEIYLYYSDEKLKNFAKLLGNYSIDHQSWMKNYIELMKENSDVSLKTYRTLLNEGERILSAIESTNSLNPLGIQQSSQSEGLYIFKKQIDNLRYFIKSSNEFIEECQNLLSIKHQQRIRSGNEYRRTNGLNDLLELIKRIPNLNFSCTEIDQILEFKMEIENFDKACRTLLSKKNRPIQEFDDLISLGESFGINIPSLTFITRIRDRLNWVKTYSIIQKGIDPLSDKKEVFTIEKLKQFFEEGLSILSKEDINMIKDMEIIVNNSEEFEQECTEFLNIDYVENFNMDKLKFIAERFRTEKLFISMENYIELSKLHIYSKLISQFNEFKNSNISITYADGKQMHNLINESELKFNDKILISELLKTEEFINDLWKKLSDIKIITTLSKDVNLDHLNNRLTINSKLIEKLYQFLYKSEFSLSEEDKYENSSSFVTKFCTDEESDDTSIKFYCLCREYEFGTMVECDKCNEWYHISCVGEQVSNSEDDTYTCPLCKLIDSKNSTDSFLSNQVTLTKCYEIKQEFLSLKIHPSNESKVLDEKILQIINDKDISLAKRLDKLMFILRCVYGCGIYLDDVFANILEKVRVYGCEYDKIKTAEKLKIEAEKLEEEKKLELKLKEEELKIQTEKSKIETVTEDQPQVDEPVVAQELNIEEKIIEVATSTSSREQVQAESRIDDEFVKEVAVQEDHPISKQQSEESQIPIENGNKSESQVDVSSTSTSTSTSIPIPIPEPENGHTNTQISEPDNGVLNGTPTKLEDPSHSNNIAQII